jgi:hypothetical protein
MWKSTAGVDGPRHINYAQLFSFQVAKFVAPGKGFASVMGKPKVQRRIEWSIICPLIKDSVLQCFFLLHVARLISNNPVRPENLKEYAKDFLSTA